MQHRRQLQFIAFSLLALILFSACRSAAPTAAPTPTNETAVQDIVSTPTSETKATQAPLPRPYRFVVITHGQADDPFWAVVQKGVFQAAEDMRVEVVYQSPADFNLTEMIEMIENATTSRPDGLVISIPDANVVGGAIERAVAAGIPVFSINSGAGNASRLGVLGHVGQTEYEAGYGGGQRLVQSGVTKAICVNLERGNLDLEVRCQGFVDALQQAGGDAILLEFPAGTERAAVQQAITQALDDDEEINGVFTLGPIAAQPALAALRDLGLIGTVRMATFDLTPEILQAIKDDEILFAIDQQQYLQGYLPIVFLTLFQENRHRPVSPIYLTGPSFVTKQNVDVVMALSQQGLR